MPCTIKHHNELPLGESRELTLTEKKALNRGNIVYIQAYCGCYLRVRVNGRPKIWVRQPNRAQVPYKYGLYGYGYITEKTIVKVEV
jgi:hypothetical protein